MHALHPSEKDSAHYHVVLPQLLQGSPLHSTDGELTPGHEGHLDLVECGPQALELLALDRGPAG